MSLSWQRWDLQAVDREDWEGMKSLKAALSLTFLPA